MPQDFLMCLHNSFECQLHTFWWSARIVKIIAGNRKTPFFKKPATKNSRSNYYVHREANHLMNCLHFPDMDAASEKASSYGVSNSYDINDILVSHDLNTGSQNCDNHGQSRQYTQMLPQRDEEINAKLCVLVNNTTLMQE
jgi:hypothetical protein